MRRTTQAQTLAWVAERWPGRTEPNWRAMKLGEEAGEVLGAVMKTYYDGSGRKTEDDIAQETAQVVICAMALAESVGFDLDAAVDAEYDRCTAAPNGRERCADCGTSIYRTDTGVWLHSTPSSATDGRWLHQATPTNGRERTDG